MNNRGYHDIGGLPVEPIDREARPQEEFENS